MNRAVASFLLAGVFAAAAVGPAAAHRLKLFATVEAGDIDGYAFFVGGGRPEGVDFIVKDGTGREVHRGKTDGEGRFHWRPERAGDYDITVDAGDGHWTEGKIAMDRFGPSAESAAPVAASTAPATSIGVAIEPGVATADPVALQRMIEASVDRAVERQIRPLIEAQVAAEGRVRLNDVMGGIGMIVGLAGMALWVRARRRGPDGEGRS